MSPDRRTGFVSPAIPKPVVIDESVKWKLQTVLSVNAQFL